MPMSPCSCRPCPEGINLLLLMSSHWLQKIYKGIYRPILIHLSFLEQLLSVIKIAKLSPYSQQIIMDRPPRTEEVSCIHKLYFIFSFVAIPIGLGGIAGGVVLIILKPGVVAAVCGSVVIFLSFCFVAIPIGTSLIILHMRLKRQGSGLVITKSYVDVSKPRPRSFRSINGGNSDDISGTVVANPYMEKEKHPNFSKLLRNYHEVEESEARDISANDNMTDRVEEPSQTERGDIQHSGPQHDYRRKTAAPAPQVVAELHKNTSDVKQSPRLGKPVPVPVVPMGYYNQAFDDSAVKSQLNDAAKTDEFQMTIHLETTSQEKHTSSTTFRTADTPQNRPGPPRNALAHGAMILPPRNVSSLYPVISPSNSNKYEEIGTRM